MHWAAAEASRRHASLRVVACPAVPPAEGEHRPGARRYEGLSGAVGALRRRYPDVSIEARSTYPHPPKSLLEGTSCADLLIVGTLSAATDRGWLLGSDLGMAARRSSCPVIVVRGRQQQPLRRILVGVDGSNASSAALAWAVDEADCHDAEVTVVHAWQQAGGPGRAMRPGDLDRADAQCMLDLVVRQAEKRSNRTVRGELIEGEAIAVLTASSEKADLLAVGSRGRSGFRTMLFGSAALFLAQHASCPVAVIHPRVQSHDPGPPLA